MLVYIEIITRIFKKNLNTKCLSKPCENSFFSSLSLLVMSFEEEI